MALHSECMKQIKPMVIFSFREKKITENNSIDEITDTESSRLSYMIYWLYVDVSISVTVFPYNTNHITFT